MCRSFQGFVVAMVPRRCAPMLLGMLLPAAAYVPVLTPRCRAFNPSCQAAPVSVPSRAAVSMLSSPGIIDAAVSFDTFAPQFLWLLIVAFPRSEITARVMGSIGPVVGLSLVHLAVVLLAATAPGGTEPIKIFADVFDPSQNQLDGMVRLFEVRDFVAEEWPVSDARARQNTPPLPCMLSSRVCALTPSRSMYSSGTYSSAEPYGLTAWRVERRSLGQRCY